jgi:predicted solute-binding protein
MFWAIDAGRVDLRGLEFEPVVADIESLNRFALEGRLEVSAVSLGAYPAIAERYALPPAAPRSASATDRSWSPARSSLSSACASSKSSYLGG